MRLPIIALVSFAFALLAPTLAGDARAAHHEKEKRAAAAAKPDEDISCREAGTQTCCSWTVKDPSSGRKDTGSQCVATKTGPMPEKAKMRTPPRGGRGPGDVAAPGPGATAKPEWDVDCYKVGDETCCSWIVYYPSIDESSAGVECSGD